MLKDNAGTSLATLVMIVIMLPCFLMAMYEKHGQPLEVVVKNIIQTKFVRPKERLYQTQNFSAVLEKQRKLEKEICPQLIFYSLLCKWFRIAVLPADKELYAELYHTEDMRHCSVCSASFASSSNRAIYCPDCRKRITRRQTAERMRKMRGNRYPLH